MKLLFQNPQALIILKSSKMTIKELKAELKRRNAQGFSQKNKSELLKQLQEICQEEHIGKSVCNKHGVMSIPICIEPKWAIQLELFWLIQH